MNDFGGLLAHFSNVDEALRNDIEKMGGHEGVFDAFQMANNFSSDHDFWYMYFTSTPRADMRQCMSEHEQKAFDALPDMFKVYRGISVRDGDSPEDYEVGFSWTLNRKVAEWFSVNHIRGGNVGNDRQCYLQECWVEKSAVIWVLLERDEMEIVANPEYMANQEAYIFHHQQKVNHNQKIPPYHDQSFSETWEESQRRQLNEFLKILNEEKKKVA